MPSLALVRQTLRSWFHQALGDGLNVECLAVCSDQDVSQTDDPLMDAHDVGISVTTDSKSVSDFLGCNNKKIKVVITTYQSGKVIIDGVTRASFCFDLGIFDEAHKTTGDKSKEFALLLVDSRINIKRKIFMTATERQFVGDTTNILSMDDQDTYGKIIDQLSYKVL